MTTKKKRKTLTPYGEWNRDEWPEGYTWCRVTFCNGAGPMRGSFGPVCEYHWKQMHEEMPDVEDEEEEWDEEED